MTGALILAAGAVPEGSVIKPTDDIRGIPSIKRIILTFQQAGIKKIAVVTGYNAEETEKRCGHKSVVFLHNDDYEAEDMLGSVKIGLEYFKDKCDRVFISPADVPFFSRDTLKKMNDTPEEAIIPICRSVAGHPILLSQGLFDKILEYDGTGGFVDAITGEGAEPRYLNVRDEGIFIDTQNYEDFYEVVENHGLRNLRAGTKVSLSCEKDFFGPGIMLLLTLVMETGSLKQAARSMGLSIGKAVQIVANAEGQLGFKLLESRSGGYTGGTSTVTEKTQDLMRRYEVFDSEVAEFAQVAFERNFSGF